MANEIRIDNINSIFGEAASIDDSDYIYIYKTSTHTLCRITKSLLNLAVGGGGLSPSDIVDNLTTGGRDKALSAEQGKALKALIDAIETSGVVMDTELDEESSHPLTNKAICDALAQKQDTISGLETIINVVNNAVTQDELKDVNGNSVLNAKIVVANDDGRIPYSVMSSMVLMSIDFDPSGDYKARDLIGHTFFYMQGLNGFIRHYKSATEYVDQPVSYDVIYYNVEDSKFYRWNGNNMMAVAIGGGGGGSVVIIDALTSNDSNAALSAKQGKFLNDNKQDKLISGENIKKINGVSLLSSGNIVVPTAGADGRMDYATIPRVVLENMGIVSVSNLGNQTWKNNNIGKSFFVSSTKRIISVYNDGTDDSPHGATSGQAPEEGVVYYNKGASSDTYAAGFYRWDKSQNSGAGGFVPISVGGGVAANIQVVENEGQASNNGIYFFVYSPSQVVGFFNSLLHGDIDGESYEQNTLYDVRKLRYNSVTQEFGDITLMGNNVGYRGVRTPLKNYGEVVLSNTIKMAETSDMALISFMVARPFFAATDVRISFNSSEVDVYKLDNGIWSNVPNNTSFHFLPDDDASEVYLKVIRKGISDYGNISTSLSSIIGFNNGYETKEAKIVYSPTKVWYKEGSMFNWSVGVANSLENDFGSDTARITSTDGGVLTIDATNGKTYCPLVNNVPFDLSKFNVFYAVILDRGSAWTDCMAYLPNWGGANNSQVRYRAYAASFHLSDTAVNIEEFDDIKNKLGFYVLNCFIHDKRRPDVVNMNLYIEKLHGGIRVKEFGVITYDESQI